jgi:hypothetical protein
MRVVTFGSCLARFAGQALVRRSGARLLGSVYHNQIDRFVSVYVEARQAELDRAVLAGLRLRPEAARGFAELIGNQYREDQLGRHATPRDAPGFLAAVEAGEADLVLLDNFMELRARLLRPRRHAGASLFFPLGMAENTAALFVADQLLDPDQAARDWRALVRWLRRKLPRARLAMLPFPGFQYDDRPHIGTRSAALSEALGDPGCPVLPLLRIPEAHLLPGDRTHFAPAQYETYADLALRAAG